MKKILKLTGVQELSKTQQKQIKGRIGHISCCHPNPRGGGRDCRISLPGGASFCEPGRCRQYGGGCIFY
ncbi:hypothetical protein [Aquimarina aggregata]|uniref:hypothetical protein n=1 Tax=Aquimarina aggregata TaxID=1642818 RepID=UPI002491FE0C|nr:hypothetical protein [Aquimarina aggregata]